MSVKLVKICPTSLSAVEMHVPMSVRYHPAPPRTTTEIGKPWSVVSPLWVEQVELCCAAGGNMKWLSHGRGQSTIPQDVQHEAACGPAVPSLGIGAEEWKCTAMPSVYADIQRSIILNIWRANDPDVHERWVDEWIVVFEDSGVWGITRNRMHAPGWMDLESMMFSHWMQEAHVVIACMGNVQSGQVHWGRKPSACLWGGEWECSLGVGIPFVVMSVF